MAQLKHGVGARSWLDGPLFTLFIAALMGNLSLSLDIILPVMPQVAADYALDDPTRVRILLTVFVLTFGLGQMGVGILSDRYGRRPILGAAIGLYALASVLCALAPTFEMLVIGRGLQGLAAAGPRVIAVAIVRDRMSGAAMAKALSTAAMIFMLAPIVAPFVGEVTASIAGWRAVFVVLLLLALPILAVVLIALPETCPPDNRTRIKFSVIAANLTTLALSRQTVGNIAVSTLIYGAMFGFVGLAPFIYRDIYGVTSGFSAIFATFGLGIVGSAFINSRAVMRFGPAHMQRVALIFLTTVSTIFLGLTQIMAVPIWLFHLLILAIMAAKGMVYSNTNTLAVDPHARFAGLASSVVGGMAMLGSAVIAQLTGVFYDGDYSLVAKCYAGMGALATLISVLCNRAINDTAGEQ
jgi:DHA1 family bicyclomycin/chloramphenicol resistance-like MFS transporter